MTSHHFVRAASLADVREQGILTTQVDGHTVAIFNTSEGIFAVDNRCPHMGFPLDRGTVQDGILTCYWHYARFDMKSGGTFDLFADDARVFPVEVRDEAVWVDVRARANSHAHQEERLRVGLERDLPLVIAKSVLTLLGDGADWRRAVAPFRIGLDFGARYRQGGWGQGLTILTCMMNLLPALPPEDRPRALYQGLSAVAADSFNHPPRFVVRPLPGERVDVGTLKRWFRQFVEVRDDEGAERCIISAIRAGADQAQMADMLFAAATDHRYIQIGHVLDFTNKALEALDVAGWDMAEQVLPSLATNFARASRMEEANAWRNPVDLIAILEAAFAEMPGALSQGQANRGHWAGEAALLAVLLQDDPRAIADGLLAALADGATEVALAAVVSHAAALRIARFHTSNEFGDWDTALHTFTFANGVEQGLRRAPSVELLRGVFDAAMSVYLDRFLNIPPARLPRVGDAGGVLLEEMPALLNQQQQVNNAGTTVAQFLYQDGDPAQLRAMLGKLLLREDRDFHTIQAIEAACKQSTLLPPATAAHALIAAARYLAAHAPTVRAQGQTYQIASRLHRGEKLFEG